MMELYAKNRDEWRKWLEENHSTVKGIWLIYYKKLSGKPRISYPDAVEEAICFGWIDGKIKRVDDYYYKQWFTPRRKGSSWSKLNISRAQKLIDEGLMRPEGMTAYRNAVKVPQSFYDIRAEVHLTIPDDLLEALKGNSEAYNNFLNFPPSSRKLYVFWLNAAKRAETRRGRIIRIVGQAEKNQKAQML
jgi:uncharacterized protein YdeI (YjbR/CyaY-like superfamily)